FQVRIAAEHPAVVGVLGIRDVGHAVAPQRAPEREAGRMEEAMQQTKARLLVHPVREITRQVARNAETAVAPRVAEAFDAVAARRDPRTARLALADDDRVGAVLHQPG